MTDTIADLFVRIINARMAGLAFTEAPYSSMKEAILKVLKKEQYIVGYTCDKKAKMIKIDIQNSRNFSKIVRISKPSRRLYVKSKNIPRPKSGYGTVIVSTPKGVLSGEEARRSNIGGEIICEVY